MLPLPITVPQPAVVEDGSTAGARLLPQAVAAPSAAAAAAAAATPAVGPFSLALLSSSDPRFASCLRDGYQSSRCRSGSAPLTLPRTPELTGAAVVAGAVTGPRRRRRCGCRDRSAAPLPQLPPLIRAGGAGAAATLRCYRP